MYRYFLSNNSNSLYSNSSISRKNNQNSYYITLNSSIFILLILFFNIQIVKSDWLPLSLVDKSVPRTSRFGHCSIAVNTRQLFNYQQPPSPTSSAWDDDDSSSDDSDDSNDNPNPPLSYWIYGGVDQFNMGMISQLFIMEIHGDYQVYNYDQSKPSPQLRWGHSCTLLNDTTILVYGGTNVTSGLQSSSSLHYVQPSYSDLWLYNITSNEWSLLSNGSTYNSVNHTNSPSPLPPVVNNSTDFINNTTNINNSSNNGNSTNSNSTNPISNSNSTTDIQYANANTTEPPIANYTIEIIPTSPQARVFQAIASNDTHLFLFGGLGNNSEVLGDFWIFNVDSMQWKNIKPYQSNNSTNTSTPIPEDDEDDSSYDDYIYGLFPEARYGHTATFIRDRFYIFGGFNRNHLPLNDLWMFDTEKSIWIAEYNSPKARAFHMMDSDNSDKNRAIYIYGGLDLLHPITDLVVFDLDARVWYPLEPITVNPPAIYLASISYSAHSNGLVMYGGVDIESESYWVYQLTCNCNARGGCFYGICNCFSGYFGEYCGNSIDGPILLGLGLAICVPILCFGWCVLRCTPLTTRLKILTMSIIVVSSLLFISVQTSLASWLPVCILSLLTGLGGLYGIMKSRQSKILFMITVADVLSLAACALGLVTYLPSCMMGNCKNDATGAWLPKFAIIMAFVEASLLILVLPISLKLYRHRRLLETITHYPAVGNPSVFNSSAAALNPLIKKLNADENNNNNDNNNTEATTTDNTQKALNYLTKEHKLRTELNRIRLSKAVEELRIKIDRENVLEDSYNQISILPTNMLIQNFNIKFTNEEGVDMGGLKKEWLSLLFKKLFDTQSGLFITNSNYTLSINPNSHQNSEHLAMFYFAGRMVAKSVSEGIHLDHTFSRTIYKLILGKPPIIDDLFYVDAEFYKSLMWILDNSIEDMEEVTFSTTVEHNGEIQLVDLKPGGRDIAVNEDNKHEFVKLLSEWRFQRDITDQSYNFVLGFREVIPLELLDGFNECELELFMCGLTEIDVEDWKNNTIYRGYNPGTSQVIEWFWQIVGDMEMESRVRLLQFVTGNARLPPAGFQSLISADGPTKFQIHKSYAPDNQLPVARTCFNRLDLPNYESKERLQSAILIAIHEGLPGFGLA